MINEPVNAGTAGVTHTEANNKNIFTCTALWLPVDRCSLYVRPSVSMPVMLISRLPGMANLFCVLSWPSRLAALFLHQANQSNRLLVPWIGDLKCQSSAGKNRQPPNICTSTEEIFDLRPSVFFQVTDPIKLHDSVAIVQDEPSVHQRFVSRTTAFELKNQQMRAPKDDQFECCPFTVP
ncbi:hypothetical protein T4B_5767 [Trichinella pseudospiralis]|uniref:Uncharacterized protein n=1 Tax=Trichinella pseudospiralis TaxID=6337 RepID=A0A0V1JCD7_TRIPS|nr:hypothetical protein T4B_5767 [Trichinella pseudospiralis]